MDQLLPQLLDTLLTILSAMVTASMPWLFSWLRDHVKSEQSKKLIDEVAQLADWAVHEVQPAGSENDTLSNQAKKAAATTFVKQALAKHKLSASDEAISGAIESAVAGMHLGWDKAHPAPIQIKTTMPEPVCSETPGPGPDGCDAGPSLAPTSVSVSVSESASDSDFHLGGESNDE